MSAEPKTGEWQRWGGWGKCSVTCDGGMQHRYRVCLVARGSQAMCRGDAVQTDRCSFQKCDLVKTNIAPNYSTPTATEKQTTSKILK